MDVLEHARSLEPFIANGNTLAAVDRISTVLRTLKPGPFHKALDLDFKDSPQEIARHFDLFIKAQEVRFEVRAIYAETNAFEFNTGRWYFDLFAYRTCGSLIDAEWLCDHDSVDFASFTLTGMERLQIAYQEWDEEFEQSGDMAALLIIAKFQDLIRRSVPLMKHLRCPVIATTHDYDWFARFTPNNTTSPRP
jgi:hypothetical protein